MTASDRIIIESIRIRENVLGESAADATVTYNGPWALGLTVTHFFDETGTGGSRIIHHTTNRHGYIGILQDPQRFGDRLDESWVRNYIDYRTR